MRQPGGIRNKITFWFFLVVSFMVVISIITYEIVQGVEEKLFNIEKVDAFLEEILEVRMMEKNFLLYRDENSMQQWANYLDITTQQLTLHEKLFVRLSSFPEISEVQQVLKSYKETFAEFRKNPTDDGLAIKLREQGNRLTTLAEELIVQEHQTIHRLLKFVRNSLLLVLPFLVFLFSAVAALLGRGIVSSLKQLEQHAATIAAGNFLEAPFSSDNREINSLINAFNQMSRELRLRQQQLVRSEKLASLGTMLAGVAHEFNNPLSNISSSVQILAEEMEGREDAFVKELVEQIGSESIRAAAIVKTLLSLAREENFHRDHYLLRPLWKEIIDLFKGQAGEALDVQLAISDDILIFADKQKIQQVFINLLKNSSDALNGRGTIRIQAGQNGNALTMTVSDDGPGIPKQLQGKVFDPFFTTKDTGEGAGLGLFIVHDIIVQHGGNIKIDSSARGTVFTIMLPNDIGGISKRVLLPNRNSSTKEIY